MNKKLILTLAIGNPEFAQQALNLCLSIRANMKDDSGIDVGLIYITDCINENLAEIILPFFNSTQWFTPEQNYNPIGYAFELKTRLYQLVEKWEGYEEIIFIDADSLILPGANVAEWFTELAPYDITVYCNDIYDYANKKRSRKDYTFWCDPEKVELPEWFILTKEPLKMPQINSSFIYFKKSEEAHKIFEMAQYIWNLPYEELKYQRYKGVKPDELCFNLAFMAAGLLPHQQTFRPIFFEAFSGARDIEYIKHEYKALGFAGVHPPSQSLTAYYNKLVKYYRDYFGINIEYARVQARIKKEPRKIFGFWHICMINNWKEVIKEQMQLLLEGGLYDAADFILVGAVGDEKDKLELQKILAGHAKLKIPQWTKKIDEYEFPTLRELKLYADAAEPHYGFYIHTKGVGDQRGKHWRDYMNYFNITKWADMQDKIRGGYDLCGVKLIRANGAHPMHYSGNFWHYDSNYIKTLAPILNLNVQDRFQAEMWVCSGQPEAATLCQKMIDHFNLEPFK